MALNRVWLPSPNYSGRGASVRLIVLHTSEGAQDLRSLGSFFANPASGVSSHVGIDDVQLGVIGEYVRRDQKAWTAANANPVAVQAELCTPSGAAAGWSNAVWQSHPTMLRNTADWIAEEAAAFGIPIVKLTPQQAQGSGRGVCQHSDLGSWGGGHYDCGGGFPIDQVLQMAQGGVPAPAKKGTTMWTLRDDDSGGTWVADETGAVFAYDGAPYLGGANTSNPANWPCSGLAQFKDKSGNGYLVTLDSGSSGGDRFRRYRYPRDGSARK